MVKTDRVVARDAAYRTIARMMLGEKVELTEQEFRFVAELILTDNRKHKLVAERRIKNVLAINVVIYGWTWILENTP